MQREPEDARAEGGEVKGNDGRAQHGGPVRNVNECVRATLANCCSSQAASVAEFVGKQHEKGYMDDAKYVMSSRPSLRATKVVAFSLVVLPDNCSGVYFLQFRSNCLDARCRRA